MLSFGPSIHRLTSACLGLGCGGGRLSRVFKSPFSLPTFSSSSLGFPRHSYARWDVQSLQLVLGLTWGLFLVGRARKISKGKRARCTLSRSSKSLIWRRQRLYTKLLSLSLQLRPATLLRKLMSPQCPC